MAEADLEWLEMHTKHTREDLVSGSEIQGRTWWGKTKDKQNTKTDKTQRQTKHGNGNMSNDYCETEKSHN